MKTEKLIFKTNLKTDLYGFLRNDGTVYEIPANEAKTMVEKGWAEYSRSHADIEIEELEKKGTEKLLSELKRNKQVKENLIKVNTKGMDEAEVEVAKVTEKYDAQIEKLKGK